MTQWKVDPGELADGGAASPDLLKDLPTSGLVLFFFLLFFFFFSLLFWFFLFFQLPALNP